MKMDNQSYTSDGGNTLDDMLYLLNCYDVWSATPSHCNDNPTGDDDSDHTIDV